MKSLAGQYRIIGESAGWIDQRARGRLRFDGRDAKAFLHALVTNDVQSLASGLGVYAALLTPQGRMLADLVIHDLGDHLLADVAPGQAEPLAARFDRLIFSEDVRVQDVSASIAHLTIVGGHAAAILTHAFALHPLDPAQLETLPVLGHIQSGEAILVRSDAVQLPVFDVFIRSESFDGAVKRLAELGAPALSSELFEALRVDAGRPAFGVDMTEETIPLEAGLLERAISTTKGCYVGQEVIVRVLHRGGGRVAKRLVKLAISGPLDTPPSAGSPLFDGEREIGRITSAAMSPHESHPIALAYVHRDVAEVGRTLSVGAATDRHRAQVIALAG
jgi:folate-binding protein YgfZ